MVSQQWTGRPGRLEGKVALVVGGTSGIGRAIATCYGREGATVVVGGRRRESNEAGMPTDELIRSAGGRARYVQLDVTDSATVDAAIGSVVDKESALHIVVCSAGAIGGAGDSRTIGAEAIDEQLMVDVRGTFFVAQAALRHFVPESYGKLIAVSSNFGLVGVAGLAAYCAAKAAVIGMMRALAVEFGGNGININTLCPGATRTVTGDEYRAAPAIIEHWRRMTPLRMSDDAFMADAADVANAALFLGSDEARFMTGACLVVDGGWSAV